MSFLRHGRYTIEVETVYSGGKHGDTNVYVFVLGPRGGRREVGVPNDIEAIEKFARDMTHIARLAKKEEAQQLVQARANGVLTE